MLSILAALILFALVVGVVYVIFLFLHRVLVHLIGIVVLGVGGYIDAIRRDWGDR